MSKNNLTYEFVLGEREQVIDLSNGRRAYKRDDELFETMDRYDNIDGLYRIVEGTGWAEKIA